MHRGVDKTAIIVEESLSLEALAKLTAYTSANPRFCPASTLQPLCNLIYQLVIRQHPPRTW